MAKVKTPAGPPASPADSCETCRYWDGVGDGLGRCRRYPPSGGTLKPTTTGPLALHVVTPAAEWCGEFRPRAG
jgi:hypothetical protein